MLIALYIASVLGAIALVLMMPKSSANWPKAGAVLGAATLVALWVYLSRFLPDQIAIGSGALSFYYIFSALAIMAAVRVITHTKPVYAALWFVMVVLSTAGLFLTVQSQFIAFAMIIIYGGAILVTYMFVIMLASPSQSNYDDTNDQQTPEYDKLAIEPVLAVTAGFLLLALLLNLAFRPIPQNPQARGLTSAVILNGGTDAQGNHVAPLLSHNLKTAQGMRTVPALEQTAVNPQSLQTSNSLSRGKNVTDIERIGLALFSGHPLGIELAGVILTLSLIGAVVIAKMKVDDEEKIVSPHRQRAAKTSST